jgi:hypothetical protein
MEWNWNNKPIQNPAGWQKIGISLLLIVTIVPTIIPHLIMRFFGGDGFMVGNRYEPDGWRFWACMVGFYGALVHRSTFRRLRLRMDGRIRPASSRGSRRAMSQGERREAARLQRH